MVYVGERVGGNTVSPGPPSAAFSWTLRQSVLSYHAGPTVARIAPAYCFVGSVAGGQRRRQSKYRE